jgi:hypothetical protein
MDLPGIPASTTGVASGALIGYVEVGCVVVIGDERRFTQLHTSLPAIEKFSNGSSI